MFQKNQYGYTLIGVSVLIGFLVLFNENWIIPPGYDLAIDGYIVSRTLIIIFIINIISKVGFCALANKKDQ